MPDRTNNVRPADLRFFLCHASEDHQQVISLCHKLDQIGFRPWISRRELEPGERWDEKIRTVLRNSDAVIVCVSTTLVKKLDTHYVGRELRYALRVASEKPAFRVIPVKVEDCDLPASLAHLHSISLEDADGFSALLDSLESVSELKQAVAATSPTMTRRTSVAMTLTGFAGVASWLSARSLSILREDERDSIPSYQKQERLRHLLFAANALDIVPPSNHPRIRKKVRFDGGRETYGHEYSILLCLKEQLPSRSWEYVEDSWQPSASHSLVCLGSGASNRLTNSLVGDLAVPRFVVGNSTEVVRLAYGTKAIGGDRVWHLQYGDLYPGRNSAIVSADGTVLAAPQVEKGRHLMEDLLLVSRIPGPKPGTTATIFAGLHGPGTRATELAVGNLQSKYVDYIAQSLNWSTKDAPPYFQAVFRARDFQEIDHSWVPRTVECVGDPCPPQVLMRVR